MIKGPKIGYFQLQITVRGARAVERGEGGDKGPHKFFLVPENLTTLLISSLISSLRYSLSFLLILVPGISQANTGTPERPW